MYYDRRIDDALISIIRPGGALSWLIGHVRSEQGRRRHAHLQFRRDPKDRPRGSIQLYWGRTSPFELRLRRGGRVRLTADPAYRDASKALFSHAIPLERLGALEGELRSHLDSVWELLSSDRGIGTLCSRAAVAASPVLSEGGLLMISTATTFPVLTSNLAGNAGTDYHEGYYHVTDNDLIEASVLAHFTYEELVGGYRTSGKSALAVSVNQTQAISPRTAPRAVPKILAHPLKSEYTRCHVTVKNERSPTSSKRRHLPDGN